MTRQDMAHTPRKLWNKLTALWSHRKAKFIFYLDKESTGKKE
jgi:hypothetical protein